MERMPMTDSRPARVLILGGGFGGVYCAKMLEDIAGRDGEIEISLVNKENFFLFTPMLPQVVSGMIEASHLVVPIRQILKRTRFYETSVESVDHQNKRVILQSNIEDDESTSQISIEYDHLVVALGSETNMEMPYLKDTVFVLKSLRDAIVLRNHVIEMLEHADVEPDIEKRKQLLTFVAVGGGLSGVETAAELNGFLHEAVKYYPNIRKGIREAPIDVIIVQSRERILPELDRKLAEFTQHHLKKRGVTIITNSRTTNVTKDHVEITSDGGKSRSAIPTKTVIWTVGISQNPLLSQIPCERHASGKLMVDEFLKVKGVENVWGIGDCACVMDKRTNNAYPATAQHAIREAKVAAHNIVKCITGSKELHDFEYKLNAQMAVIGNRSAIARLMGINLYGFAAWFLWRSIYLQKLPGLEKRLRVLLDWTVRLFFDGDITHIRTFRERRQVQVSEIMNRNVISMEAERSAFEIATAMEKGGFGSLLITENGKALGIVTERDLVRKVIAKRLDPNKVRLKDIMTAPIIAINPSSRIDEASRLMGAHCIRRLPVLENGRLVGIITVTDVAKCLAKSRNHIDPSQSTMVLSMDVMNSMAEEAVKVAKR
jgi:NADH dehydrogenase